MKLNPQLKQELVGYLKDKMANKGKPKITVIAPYELSNQELDEIKNKIEILKSAEIKVEVDKNLLAGIVIKYGSRVIDLSLKSELQKLENTLYETA